MSVGSKRGIEEHVGEDVEQFVETIVAGLGMVAGHFFAGESVEVTADAFDVLGNLAGGTAAGAFEQQVLDEMADAVELRRFVAAADPDPEAEADAGHVRHFGGGDGQAVF